MKYLKIIIVVSICVLLLSACGPKQWEGMEPIMLDDISPIGIEMDTDGIWLSDGDRSTLFKIDKEGQVISKLEALERPMHIASSEGHVYIPSYGLDAILKVKGDIVDTMQVGYPMDAPAGVSVLDDKIAIADFYNHRILYYNGSEWSKIGGDEKGKGPGQFDYPTDVQLLGDKIYVADAYNNRGQIFSNDGSHLLTFGEDLEMNAATGIFVTEDEIFMTDFEHDRIIVFDHNGKTKQILETGFLKPTDVMVSDEILYVSNYRGGYISRLMK